MHLSIGALAALGVLLLGEGHTGRGLKAHGEIKGTERAPARSNGKKFGFERMFVSRLGHEQL